jgi:hypothetical protein
MGEAGAIRTGSGAGGAQGTASAGTGGNRTAQPSGGARPTAAPDRAALEAYAASLDKAEREGTGPYGDPRRTWFDNAKSRFDPFRAGRIRQVLDLLAKKQYDRVIDLYFPVGVDPSATVDSDKDIAAMQAQVRAALRVMLGTSTGARLAVALAHTGEHKRIMVGDGDETYTQPYSDTVIIKVRDAVSDFERYFRPLKTTLPVVITHELGHAVMGYGDPDGLAFQKIQEDRDSFLRTGKLPHPLSWYLRTGDNVKYVENPIRRELGLPERPSYLSVSQIREAFPELFAPGPKSAARPASRRGH